MFLKKMIVLILVNSFLLSMTHAHEMWIEPVNYLVKRPNYIYAHEKVGQDFKGNVYSYLSSSYESLNVTVNGKTRAIDARLGDIPAIAFPPSADGLTILSATTTPSVLEYKKWGKFESFVKSKGLDWVIAAHKKRGLPEQNFSESYRRFAKSLVKVGHGKGDDQKLGLRLEWIIETNPYTSGNKPITARILWEGKPYAKAHVSVFNRVGNQLIKSELTTNAEGRVVIPRAKGGDFMINAVQMILPPVSMVESRGVVWESLWASMTYSLKVK